MAYKPKLIEVSLPLVEISDAGAREQSRKRGKPTQIHKWWAGRPLVTARAVLWASMVDDPSGHPDRFPTVKTQNAERLRLFGILERLLPWEASTDQKILEEAHAEIAKCFDGEIPPVVDPFGGGGAIPLEAQRLGLTAFSGDLNPVAVLIQKAMIEIPPRFAGCKPVHSDLHAGLATWAGAQGLAADVEAYGQWMSAQAEQSIGHLYPDATGTNGEKLTPIAWIWARTVESPDPTWAGQVPLVKSWVLSKKSGRPLVWIEPVIDRSMQTITYEIRHGGTPTEGTISRGNGVCIATGSTIPNKYIRAEALAGRMGEELLALVAKGPTGGRVFCEPTPSDASSANCALPEWVPTGVMSNHPQYMGPTKYGLDDWWKLFRPRQLVGLVTLSNLLPAVAETVKTDAVDRGMTDDGVRLREGGRGATAYADAIVTYLAFAVDRVADWNNTSCGWDSKNCVNQHLFTRQAIPMLWDFCEIKGHGGAAGSLGATLKTLAGSIRALPSTNHIVQGRVLQREARALLADHASCVVSTDPPYYDQVPYADISDFFYVWLRHNLSDVWPDECATLMTPKAEELVADNQRFGSRKGAEEHFESGMSEFMAQVREVQHPEVPATIFYAFKATEIKDGDVISTGWDTFLQGILDAGMAVTSTWPMRTENKSRLRALGSNVLSSSIVLTCRPLEELAALATRGEFIAALRDELPGAVHVLQSGNIAPVDMAQSAIGPGIKVFSRFAKVVEADGSPMPVRQALVLINDVVSEILEGGEAEFDADTRFAYTWYAQYGYNPATSGDADTLARAKNTSLSGIADAGIGEARAGSFRLFERSELDADWTPVGDDRLTVWEATQYLIAALERSESEASELMRLLGGFADRARQLAYVLFQKATDKGWADEASVYNGLITAWPVLQAASIETPSDTPDQATLL